jgi:hypothetical protein
MTPLKSWYVINNEIAINADGNLAELIPINNSFSLPYRFQFSNDTIDLLTKISKINISPVLNYLTESKLNETQNDFYSYYPENVTHNVIKISDEWYLISRSNVEENPLFDAITSWPFLFIIIITFVLIPIIVYLLYNKNKKR